MNVWWIAWFPLIVALILLYWPRKKRRRYVGKRIAAKRGIPERAAKERMIMRELAKRFIGKDSIITLLEGTEDGMIKEVTDGGIVIEKKGTERIINLDYVLKIREYPYKNGKRVSIVGE